MRQQSDPRPLSAIAFASRPRIVTANASIAIANLSQASTLGGNLDSLRGKSVLLAVTEQLLAALALIELDGIARRVVICPPDVKQDYLPGIMATGETDTIVSDSESSAFKELTTARFVRCLPRLERNEVDRSPSHQTEWVLLTSGTTGLPKLVVHTLATLTEAFSNQQKRREPICWSTFYDIRRYGGLQIFLRAVFRGGSLILSDARESVAGFLIRLGENAVTHISGTPTHWRNALMSRAVDKISPGYIRLSGEIIDQPILDSLREAYPKANIVHAFASTEAGVAFEVTDGRAGFPADLMDRRGGAVELKIEEGSLRIRSHRAALSYLGGRSVGDEDGFVDTRDIVELRANRYYFVGRKDGVINVGGMKVHPEEIEAVINAHPKVRMSLVKPRRSAITGALVVAEVVLKQSGCVSDSSPDVEEIRRQIVDLCNASLPPHKTPATIRFVPSVGSAASGKMAR